MSHEVELDIKRLVDLLNHYQGLSVPIRRLPSDVLGVIFSLYRDDAGKPAWDAALEVFWVCSRWRQIALSVPLLWSRIPVFPPQFYSSCLTDSETAQMSFVKAFLDRSKGCPLFISVLPLSRWPQDESSPPPQTVLSLLGKHVQRWKGLFIEPRTIKISDTCWKDLNHFPILDDVLLPDADEAELLIFRNAPSLTALSLNMSCIVTMLPSAYHHIENLLFSQFNDWERVASILQSLPVPSSIRVLLFMCQDLRDDDVAFENSTITSSLVYMTKIQDRFSGARLPRLLERLYTPNMTEMSVQDAWAAGLEADLPVFLNRSGGSLQFLRITLAAGQRYSLSPQALAPCSRERLDLRFISSLKEETVTGMSITELLRALTVPATVSTSTLILLPCLQALSLSLLASFCDGKELVSMIMSRWHTDAVSEFPPAARFSKLELVLPVAPAHLSTNDICTRLLGQEYYNKLIDLRNEGLKLTLRDYTNS